MAGCGQQEMGRDFYDCPECRTEGKRRGTMDVRTGRAVRVRAWGMGYRRTGHKILFLRDRYFSGTGLAWFVQRALGSWRGHGKVRAAAFGVKRLVLQTWFPGTKMGLEHVHGDYQEHRVFSAGKHKRRTTEKGLVKRSRNLKGAAGWAHLLKPCLPLLREVKSCRSTCLDLSSFYQGKSVMRVDGLMTLHFHAE